MKKDFEEWMILGEQCVYSTDCRKTGLNNNVLVCGGSGSGKTMSLSEARLLETRHVSLILTVTKRRIVNKYRSLFEQRGYRILDLNFANPEKSDCAFDPLQYVRTTSDITFLARSIIKANPQKKNSISDPYWDEAAVSLFSAEIAYVLMKKENATFADVLKFHDSLRIISSRNDMLRTTLDKKFASLEEMDSGNFAVNCWRSFKNLPVVTGGCVYGVLNTTIDTIFTPEIRKMIAIRENVDFEELSERKTILFVTSSAVNPSLHYFINMFYGQAFKSLVEYAEAQPDGTLPIPVNMLCDDFAIGGSILNFPEYISVFREKGISTTLLLQSESQLEQMYGTDNAATIINNCDSYIYLGGMDLQTAINVSIRLSVPLNQVLYMPIGQEILFRRGQQPIITQRYDILNNELYQQITRYYDAQVAAEKRRFSTG